MGAGVLAAYFSVKALEDPTTHAEAEAADSKKRRVDLGSNEGASRRRTMGS